MALAITSIYFCTASPCFCDWSCRDIRSEPFFHSFSMLHGATGMIHPISVTLCLFFFSDPKCTVCLVLTHSLTLPTHTCLLSVHAWLYLCAYESLPSHIFLSWGRPFSKPCDTIPEFTVGWEGQCETHAVIHMSADTDMRYIYGSFHTDSHIRPHSSFYGFSGKKIFQELQ